MLDSDIVDQLVGDLKPVRSRSITREGILLASVAALEVALCVGLGSTRSNLLMAMTLTTFWWKTLGLGLLAFAGGVLAIRAFNPENSPRRGLRWLLALVGTTIGVGFVLGAVPSNAHSLGEQLNWRQGVQCMLTMAALALPAIAGLGILMRRGAPTDRKGTAIAVGAAGAAWGALVFVLHCPHDDPLYVIVWYSAGCSLVVLLARLVLPPLTRW
jgi:hypothetical protein